MSRISHIICPLKNILQPTFQKRKKKSEFTGNLSFVDEQIERTCCSHYWAHTTTYCIQSSELLQCLFGNSTTHFRKGDISFSVHHFHQLLRIFTRNLFIIFFCKWDYFLVEQFYLPDTLLLVYTECSWFYSKIWLDILTVSSLVLVSTWYWPWKVSCI